MGGGLRVGASEFAVSVDSCVMSCFLTWGVTLGRAGMSCGVQWRAPALCTCAFPKDRDGGGSTGNAASAKRPLPRRRGGQREQRGQNAKAFWDEERARQAHDLEMRQKEERRCLRKAQRAERIATAKRESRERSARAEEHRWAWAYDLLWAQRERRGWQSRSRNARWH